MTIPGMFALGQTFGTCTSNMEAGQAMINTPHPGTPPRDTETSSDLSSATDRSATIADWEASLAKLLGAAFGEGNTQANLAHVARLATMGELAASIAHEINQPLGAIASQATACLRWLKRDRPDVDKVQEGLARIEREAMRAGAVVRGLATLVKRSGPQQSEVDINNAIEEVLPLICSEMRRHDVTLHCDLYPGNRPIYGDRVQLQQVLLNLMKNGIEAIAETAGLPRVLSVSSKLTVSGGVIVTVEDTGPGLDPAIADGIFDAFVTTKSDGMGMGLSICRSIIEAHGGQIWASPRVPHGTILQFILPALHETELRMKQHGPAR